jgi:hypothetical protein
MACAQQSLNGRQALQLDPPGQGDAGHFGQGLSRPQARDIGFELAPLNHVLGVEQPRQAAQDQVKLAKAIGQLLLEAIGCRPLDCPLKFVLMGMEPVPAHGGDHRARQQDGGEPLPSPARQTAGPRKTRPTESENGRAHHRG